MIEILRAKTELREFLKDSYSFTFINTKMLIKVADCLSSALMLEDTKISNMEIQSKIIQSSRHLYIGRDCVAEQHEFKEIATTMVQELLSIKDNPHECRITFKKLQLLPEDNYKKNIEIMLNINDIIPTLVFKISLERSSAIIGYHGCITYEIGLHFYGKNNLDYIQIVQYTVNDYIPDSIESLMAYWRCIEETGITHHECRGWDVFKLSSYDASLLLIDIFTGDSDFLISDESEWAQVDSVFDEDSMIYESISDLNFEQCVQAIVDMSNFYDKYYDYNPEGHRFGQSVAHALLEHALLLADTDEKIETLTIQFVENIDTQIGLYDAASFALDNGIFFTEDYQDDDNETNNRRTHFLELLHLKEMAYLNDDDDEWF